MSEIRHFLNLADAGSGAIAAILSDARQRKAERQGWPKGRTDAGAPLAGQVLAMLFEKSSTRTRVSFDMAMRQLGGSALILEGRSSQMGRGETVADTARVLCRYVDAMMIRTDDHMRAEELAKHAGAPVINGLTNLSHPCQLLADMLTVTERLGGLEGTHWAWVGDGNNVCNSLIEAASLMQFDVKVACPPGHEPDISGLQVAAARGCTVPIVRDAREAVAGAQVVVTDAWISMGQTDSAQRLAAMEPYRVDETLMTEAAEGALFLHCLPARRGEEVVDTVIDGPQSAVWDEAENRLHAQKSLLLWCLGKI